MRLIVDVSVFLLGAVAAVSSFRDLFLGASGSLGAVATVCSALLFLGGIVLAASSLGLWLARPGARGPWMHQVRIAQGCTTALLLLTWLYWNITAFGAAGDFG